MQEEPAPGRRIAPLHREPALLAVSRWHMPYRAMILTE